MREKNEEINRKGQSAYLYFATPVGATGGRGDITAAATIVYHVNMANIGHI
jgi:hypothetical protein